MSKKLTDNQIVELLRGVKKVEPLQETEKAELKLHLLDVIKHPDSRMYGWTYSFKQVRFSMLIPIIVAVIIALGSGTAVLANSAKPGDALYPIDQLMETIQQNLVADASIRAQILASLDEERLAELMALQEEKIEERREDWEEHRDEAEARVAESIERLDRLQEIFEDKLENAKDDKQKEVFQKVLDRIAQTKEHRAERLAKIQEREFPGDKVRTDAALRARFNAWLKLSSEEKNDILEDILEDFRSDDDEDDDSDEDEDRDDEDDDENEDDEDEDSNDEDDDSDKRGRAPSTLQGILERWTGGDDDSDDDDSSNEDSDEDSDEDDSDEDEDDEDEDEDDEDDDSDEDDDEDDDSDENNS